MCADVSTLWLKPSVLKQFDFPPLSRQVSVEAAGRHAANVALDEAMSALDMMRNERAAAHAKVL